MRNLDTMYNGRTLSAQGEPFMCSTYRTGNVDTNFLTIWNQDQSAIIVKAAPAIVMRGYITYYHAGAYKVLTLNDRDTAIARQYMRNLNRKHLSQIRFTGIQHVTYKSYFTTD